MSHTNSSYWQVVTGSPWPPSCETHESRSMIPPPECSYEGERLDRACGDCQSFARSHGYHLRKAPGSDKNRGRIYLVCHRQGDYEAKGTIRNTESHRTGCQFKLRIKYFRAENLTRVILDQTQHNHGPSVEATTAHIYRRCTPEEKLFIRNRRYYGDTPRETLDRLMVEFPETLLQFHDVKNEFAAARMEEERK